MANSQLMTLAYTLLPGFGFFAPRGPLRRRINVGQKLKRVSLFFDSGAEDFFAFPLIEFAGQDGRKLSKKDLIASATVSSLAPTVKKGEVLNRVITGQAFRSRNERRPELTITFTEPTEISRIVLGNRLGSMGRKARHVCLNGYHQGRLVFAHQNTSPQAMVTALAKLYEQIGLEVPTKPLEQGITAYCDDTRARILTVLDQNSSGFSARELAELLPLFAETQDFTPFAERIIAEVFAKILQRKEIVSTQTFEPLSGLLTTPDRIESSLALANSLLSKRQGRTVQVMAGKHAFQESRLVVRKERYLATLDQIFPALEACGVTPMLAYGSLLGAVRENGFLAHDDDVDLLYFDGSRTRKEALDRRADLVTAMKKHGFHMNRDFKNANFHLTNGDAKVDLFPCWKDGRKLQVMRRYPNYEPLSEAVLLPPSSTQLYGRTYPAPAKPEAFLKWRYGASWGTPDPYHEWPWPLSR